MARNFLALVGAVYLLLGAWCAWSPQATAASLGFNPEPGRGQAEYLTVYGGMQVGFGLVLLTPWRRPEMLPAILWSSLLVHGGLVAFRSLGFLRYRNFDALSLTLAATEWVLLLSSWYFWRQSSRPAPAA